MDKPFRTCKHCGAEFYRAFDAFGHGDRRPCWTVYERNERERQLTGFHPHDFRHPAMRAKRAAKRAAKDGPTQDRPQP